MCQTAVGSVAVGVVDGRSQQLASERQNLGEARPRCQHRLRVAVQLTVDHSPGSRSQGPSREIFLVGEEIA